MFYFVTCWLKAHNMHRSLPFGEATCESQRYLTTRKKLDGASGHITHGSLKRWLTSEI